MRIVGTEKGRFETLPTARGRATRRPRANPPALDRRSRVRTRLVLGDSRHRRQGVLSGFPKASCSLFVWLILSAVGSAQAAPVYKCLGADGNVAYQDRPCAATQRQASVELAPAPPPAPSPDYGVAVPAGAARGVSRGVSRAARAEPQSYECRAANGEVFYRHSACPKSIAGTRLESAANRRQRGGPESIPVSAVPLSRGEACKRLASAGSIGRRGRERDERVSTYERNQGRDACRRY